MNPQYFRADLLAGVLKVCAKCGGRSLGIRRGRLCFAFVSQFPRYEVTPAAQIRIAYARLSKLAGVEL